MADADLYSCFTWTFVLIVSFGIRIASIINTISTFIKFFSLTLIVILLLCFANYDLRHFDFWGKASHLGPIPHQINSTILTTLFFFMGIEEAIVVAAHAQKSFDVEKATVIGYLICLFLNVMVCVLSFSFYPQPEMAPRIGPNHGEGRGELGQNLCQHHRDYHRGRSLASCHDHNDLTPGTSGHGLGSSPFFRPA